MNTNGVLKLWYGQWSDCATQLATTSVTGKMIINNTGDFDISINGTGISAGAQLTINNLNWDYAGYNVADQGTDAMDYYSGGTEYQIVGCDNCPTQTATVTHTPTPTVTSSGCDTDGESSGPVEAWDNTTTYNATTGTDGVVCYNGLAYRCVQTHNLGADVGGAVIPGTDTDYWVRASSHDNCCASVTATPTATDATGDEGGDSECCGCTTSIYAMQACGSSDTIFVFGNQDQSQEDNTYNSSFPYIIIGSLDESILCEPFCARFVSHTAGGTPYGPGEDISLDHDGASYVVLSDSAVEETTNSGSATTYADCTACQNDCDYC